MGIFFYYLHWHYFIASGDILGHLKNYQIGAWHQFLISRHFKTLFSPWHRAQPSDSESKMGIGDRIMFSIIDFYIRIFAAFIRLIIILIGLIYEAILFVIFIVLFIIWILWPLLVLFLIIKGINILI